MIELPDGLLLRRARQQDRDALSRLQSAVHAAPDGSPNRAVARWTEDLFDHPALAAGEVTVVEDTRSGELVSSLSLLRQVWSYADIPFGVGRLELVATHPQYRRRGLINRQLQVLQEQSTAAGDLLQVITDLMFFHGELGYHCALTQRSGRGGSLRALSEPREPLRLRPAVLGDIPALVEIDRHARERVLLSCPRDADGWRYELTGHSPGSMVRDEILLVERAGTPIGYVLIGYGGIPSFPVPDWLPGLRCPEPVVSISGLEAAAGVDWADFAPSVVGQVTERAGCAGYLLWLGRAHPAYATLPDLTRRPPEIGWFLRVPDLTRFVAAIAPVLQRRLSRSGCTFTGTLRLHFYTHGLLLECVNGRLVRVRPWSEHSRRGSDASMPEQMFLQLLLGQADLAVLAPAYPDHRIQTPAAELLLPLLFSAEPSHVWPVI